MLLSVRIGNLLIGSKSRLDKQTDHAWVVERSKATGCKPVGLISYVGSNPTPCTRTDVGCQTLDVRKAVVSDIQQLASDTGGSSSVGRASAFQAECREFESRLPLQVFWPRWFNLKTRPSSSGVERILGKDEVAGSNPALGSRSNF
jgi:hypothetical protein